MRARILRSGKRTFICELLESKVEVEAVALAVLLKEDHLVVGDFVEIEKTAEGVLEFQIVSVEPRSSEIYRLIPREQKKKVTASNCDLLIIVTSASLPEYKKGLIDRYTIRAFQWKIPAVLVFNKMDEFNHHFALQFEEDRLKDIDVDCYECSATLENYQNQYLKLGLKELKDVLKGKTAILMGQSGVGKSKLLSRLSEGKVELLSKDLGKVGKGAHTTTWAEIVNCGDFYLIDSPGVRSFAIDDLLVEDLDEYFPDIADYSTKCKFRNCTHDSSAKACFFMGLDQADKKSEMILSRLDSYLRFKEELSKIPSWIKEKN